MQKFIYSFGYAILMFNFILCLEYIHDGLDTPLAFSVLGVMAATFGVKMMENNVND